MGQFAYNPLNGNLDFSSNGLEAGTLEFMGNISVASDFPTSAQVQENDIYRVLADVTDNDVTKTNTGDSFVAGDEIMWDGAGWALLGNYVSLLGTNNTWTGTNAFNEITGNKVRAVGSGGLLIESNNGTDVALFGVGGGAGVTFYGGVLVGATDATASQGSALVINSSVTTGSAGSASLILQGDVNSERIKIYSAGGATTGNPLINLFSHRGTIASPTATQAGDIIGGISGGGYGASAYSGNCYGILQCASENWTDSAQGTYTAMRTTANGATVGTTRVLIANDGTVTFGSAFSTGTGALYAGAGSFTHSGTTTNAFYVQADSITTGAGAYIYSNSSSNSSRYLTYIVNDHASATGTTALYVRNDSTNAVATFVGGATTNPAVYIGADALTTGSALSVNSNSASTSSFVLCAISNLNSSATGAIPLAIANLAPTATNFFRMMYLGGNSGANYLWKANGVTPNGALSGTVGDICIGADSGKAYYCSSGTTWVAM